MHLKNTTPQQFADDMITKSYEVADVYDESALNNVFIERVNASICHSLRGYWALHQTANITNISFYANFILAIQKRSRNITTNAISDNRIKTVPK